MKGILILVASAALVLAIQAAPATVMLDAAGRSLTASAPGDGSSSGTIAGGLFDDMVEALDGMGNSGAASQNTTIGAAAFGGTGDASAGAFVPDLFGESLFDVTFTLDGGYNAAVSYYLSVGGEVGPATAGFSLSGPGTSIGDALVFTGLSLESTDTLVAMLGPGTYMLSAYATAGAMSTAPDSVASGAQFEFSVTLTPKTVPEPASLALAGLALAGLAARRRRR